MGEKQVLLLASTDSIINNLPWASASPFIEHGSPRWFSLAEEKPQGKLRKVVLGFEMMAEAYWYLVDEAKDVRHHVLPRQPSHLTTANTVHDSEYASDVHRAATDIHAQGFAWIPVFSSSGSPPRSRVAESHSNSLFNSLRRRWTLFHGGDLSAQWSITEP